MTDTQRLWQPEPLDNNNSLIADYMRFLSEDGHGDFSDYDALWNWSVTELDAFWSSVWDFADIIGDRGAIAYQHDEAIRNAQFFPEARLNYAENMLRYQGSEEAIIQMREDGTRISWSHDDLRLPSLSVTTGLARHGYRQRRPRSRICAKHTSSCCLYAGNGLTWRDLVKLFS